MKPIEQIDHILKMIEAAEPNLDEINGRVFCLMHGYEFHRINIFGDKTETVRTEFYDPADRSELFVKMNNSIQVTRSRDIIKSMRPPGIWTASVTIMNGHYCCDLLHDGKLDPETLWFGRGASEELAELSATLSCIQYLIGAAEAALQL